MTVSSRLAEGDTAPAFTLPDDQGSEVSLGDFAGERVLVYFYPRANTPGCTTQA
ncbi:MAG TPA: redoxin domain-containing protein, partial [Corynebacterium sp.]|nr:redoxin domain-containing protein [Corynebacterium sp.]